MIYKLSFFIGAAISSFLDNGFKFSLDRTLYQYRRTLYFNGHIDKLNKDFHEILNQLKDDEAIVFYEMNECFGYCYHLTLYTKKEHWQFMKFEGLEDKANYQRILIENSSFDEKMGLLERKNVLSKYLINLKDIPQYVLDKKFMYADEDDLNIFKNYIITHLFNSPYKMEL